jgi:hypothetical protein
VAYIVTGPAVVLPTPDGSERYLYRGALVPEGFADDGIEHALALGLIEELEVVGAEVVEAAPEEKAAPAATPKK